MWHMSREWMNKGAGFCNGLDGSVIKQTVLHMNYVLSLGYEILQ
jgi:hypothetical protein